MWGGGDFGLRPAASVLLPPPPPPPPPPPAMNVLLNEEQVRSIRQVPQLSPAVGKVQVSEAVLAEALQGLRGASARNNEEQLEAFQTVDYEDSGSPKERLARELKLRVLQMKERGSEVKAAIQGMEGVLVERFRELSQGVSNALARELQSLTMLQVGEAEGEVEGGKGADLPNLKKLFLALRSKSQVSADSTVAEHIRRAKQKRLEKLVPVAEKDVLVERVVERDNTPEGRELDLVIESYWIEVVGVLQQIKHIENWINAQERLREEDILLNFQEPQARLMNPQLDNNAKRLERISRDIDRGSDELGRKLAELRKLYLEQLSWLDEHDFERVKSVLEGVLLPRLKAQHQYAKIKDFFQQAVNDLYVVAQRAALILAGWQPEDINSADLQVDILLQSVSMVPGVRSADPLSENVVEIERRPGLSESKPVMGDQCPPSVGLHSSSGAASWFAFPSLSSWWGGKPAN